MSYQLTLSHAPNPDVQGGYWEQPVQSGTIQTLEVDSIEQAQALCRAYIDGNHLGGGNWTGGDLHDIDGLVGHIAYSGRYFAAVAA